MIKRRTFLKSAAAAGVITAFSGIIPTIAHSNHTLRVRKSLTDMPLDDPDLSTYRDFVGLMQKKDQSQRVSWLGFSLPHGQYRGPYKYCPHGDWYFLPWHRAYMMMYENAARTLTGNDDFAIPYWDWTEQRTMPEAFADPMYKGKANPLYVPNRNRIDLPDSLVGPKVMQEIYSETVFEVFGTSRNPDQDDLDPKWVVRGGGVQGTLEATPHNNIHNDIGVYMPTAGSPRDPIFMMHHGNIDRIWANWNALGRQNSDDPLWLNMPFDDNFIAADGSLYSSIVNQLLSTEKLGYTYDNLQKKDNLRVDKARDSSLVALLSGDKKSMDNVEQIIVPNNQRATALKHLDTTVDLQKFDLQSVLTPKDGDTKEVFAVIRDIKVGENIKAFNVFINSDKPSMQLSTNDSEFVTTIAFLSHVGTHHKMSPSAIIDLTDAIKKIGSAGKRFTIQLQPVPYSGLALESVGPVVPASIEIIVL